MTGAFGPSGPSRSIDLKVTVLGPDSSTVIVVIISPSLITTGASSSLSQEVATTKRRTKNGINLKCFISIKIWVKN